MPDPVPADAQEPDPHLRLVPGPQGEDRASPGHASPAHPSPPGSPSPPSSLPSSPAAKEPLQADEAVGADPAGVRAGLEGEGWAPPGHQRDWPGVGSRVGGDRGSVCPTVGPGAPCVPWWDQVHPHLLSPSFLLLSCLSPASPSRSMSVLVSPPRAPRALTPAVSPAPPGAEVPAPMPRGRQHHRRSLERVPGNGATCPPATSVLLSGLSVCLPTPLLPTLSGWSCCPLRWGQMGMGGCGGSGGRDTLVLGGAGGDVRCPHRWRRPRRRAGPTGGISAPAPAPAWPTSSTGGW